MKNNLEAIRDKLENELDTAKGLSEIMLLIHTGICGYERNGITFKTVNNAFCLIAGICDSHVQSLDSLANELIDFQNDIKIKS